MLKAGTHLAPYEIAALLGAGGMGEVYRARDTRLGRDVAIKVLPAQFASDPGRLRRFEQEARAVAALSHPNILALYDVGTHEGSPFIVSELLEGETLRERLRSGGLTIRKAVETAVQIAQGLAAAHEKGIVHRDLKPANVFVTKDGHVKILDFGIAKLTRPDPGPQATTLTPEPSTETGALMGTVGYMSPEQVRGQPTDHRTDIFSFGCVLYEMVSGRSPFRKDTTAETMTAILHDDPPALAGIGREIPQALEGIVTRCLEKRPEDRFQSARDLAFDLALLARISDTGTGPRPELVEAPRRVRRVVMAGAVLAASTLLVLLGLLLGRHSQKPSVARCQLLTYRRGYVSAARFTSDGKTVVYSASWAGAPTELFSVRLGGPESSPLGYSHADLVAVSPSGELALLRSSHSPRYRWMGPRFYETITLAVVPFAGGTPRDVDDTVLDADYSPDGRAMAVTRKTDKDWQLEYPVGTVRAIGVLPWGLRVSRDGKRVAFFQGGGVAVAGAAGGSRTLAGDLYYREGLAWSPSGDEVWYTDGNELRAVTLSGRNRVVYSQTMRMILQDVARDGRVLVTTEDKRGRIFFRGADDAAERELTWLDWSLMSDLSPDGRQVFFCETERGVGFEGISYMRETSGAPPLKLGEGVVPHPSPDGRAVAAVRYDKNEIVVFAVGPGATRTVPMKDVNVSSARLLADGKTIVFSGSEPSHGQRLWLTDLTGSKPRPVTPEGVLAVGMLVTPEGTHVVARFQDGSWLYPLAAGEPRRLTFVQADEAIAGFTADAGSAYVYHAREAPLLHVYRVDLRTGRRELVREIALGDRAGSGMAATLVFMTPDGRSYVHSTQQFLSELYLIEGLK